eukprot:Sspe_Gene.78888::Locus_49404_Transcript_1_1_Confidence_1.000_Length_2017::g.78888::m.78888/K05657/ABCB10; ATP-binding cassette, subfamily B (MDR/TAP), member 10
MLAARCVAWGRGRGGVSLCVPRPHRLHRSTGHKWVAVRSCSQTTVVKRLVRLVLKERTLLAMGFAGLVVSTSVQMSLPILFGSVIDVAVATGEIGGKVGLPLIGGLFCVGSAASILRGYCFAYAGEKVIASLRRDLYRSVLRSEMAFFDSNKVGELVNRLSSDTTVMGKAMAGENASTLMRCGAQVVASVAIMSYQSPQLTLVVLCAVPVCTAASIIYGRIVRRLSRELQDRLAQATAVAEERLTAIREVRCFAKEGDENLRYSAEIDRVLHTAQRSALATAYFFGAMTFVGNAGMLSVLTFGASLIASGELTSGVLTSFLMYTVYVATSTMQASRCFSELMKGVGASTRVFELIDREPQTDFQKGTTVLPRIDGLLAFNDVHFNYPTRPDVEVLKGVSLTVKPSSVVAVVGGSGSGKSTIFQLLLGYYPCLRGSISIDGVDITQLDPHWLRKRIGVVPQYPMLFRASVFDNVAYGLDHPVDPEEVYAACKEANAHDFITSLPDGYNTIVTDASLSGGQRQRLSIARALVKNPSILLLDEATSALDAEGEHLVHLALERAMANRTVVMIAHRLSTVQRADTIFVMHEGVVAESGSHDALMKEHGIYRALVDRQLPI